MGLISDAYKDLEGYDDDDDKDGILDKAGDFLKGGLTYAGRQAGANLGADLYGGAKKFLAGPANKRELRRKNFFNASEDVFNINKSFNKLMNNEHETAIQKHIKDGNSPYEAIYRANENQFRDAAVRVLAYQAKKQGKGFDIGTYGKERLDAFARTLAFFNANNGNAPSLVETIHNNRVAFLNEVRDLPQDKQTMASILAIHGSKPSGMFSSGVLAFPKNLLNEIGIGITPEEEAKAQIKRLKESPLIKKELREAIEAQSKYLGEMGGGADFIVNKALEEFRNANLVDRATNLSSTINRTQKFEIKGTGENTMVVETVEEKVDQPGFGINLTQSRPKISSFLLDKDGADNYAASLQKNSSSNAFNIMTKIINSNGMNEIMVQVRNGFDKGDNFFIDKGTGTFITPDSHNLTAGQRTWFINSAFNSALNVKRNTAEGFRENQAMQRLLYTSIVEHQDINDNLKTLGNKVPLRPNKAGSTVALDDFITTDNDGNNVLKQDFLDQESNIIVPKGILSKYVPLGFKAEELRKQAEELHTHFTERQKILRGLTPALEGFNVIMNELNLDMYQPDPSYTKNLTFTKALDRIVEEGRDSKNEGGVVSSLFQRPQ